MKGHFVLQVEKGDTLKFSAVNFSNRFLVVDENVFNYDKELVIFMEPKDHQLEPVTITGLPPWDKFGEALLNLQLPPDPIALKLPENPFDFPLPMEAPSGGPQTGGVQSAGTIMTFGSDPFGEKIRYQQAIIAQWDKEQAYRAMINRKFNRDIVKRVTGISDELLDSFMRACSLSDGFIARSTEYEIGIAVKGCYMAFMERQ
jgi:hypothetical protein